MISRAEIAGAWDLFHIGAFADVESLLSAAPYDAETVRLRLWVAIRRADAEAKRHLGSWLANNAQESLAAIGRAHENVALAGMGEPLEPWLSATSKAAQAEVAYANALIAFSRDEPDRVREELSKALPQSAEQRVRYAQLRAWIPALHEQFEKQATHLLHALSLALSEDVDRYLIAVIADALAPLVREVDLGELGHRAEELLEKITWPVDRTTYRFYTQRALAWRRSLRGEWITAMHLLDSSLSAAPDAMRRGLIFADRARVNSTTGEHLSAQSSAKAALDCFGEIDWSRAHNNEAVGIFGAMDVLKFMPEHAKTLYDAASRVNLSKMYGGGHGRRVEAFRQFAISHLTDGDEALGHAQAAYKVFKELKHIHRATSCALRAVELGGGARWRERVERMIEAYPRSLAAKEYERLTSPIARVRGRMREVADLLVSSNKTAREIGETLGMAEGTVRVHIKHMNKILNVQNRTELVKLMLSA